MIRRLVGRSMEAAVRMLGKAVDALTEAVPQPRPLAQENPTQWGNDASGVFLRNALGVAGKQYAIYTYGNQWQLHGGHDPIIRDFMRLEALSRSQMRVMAQNLLCKGAFWRAFRRCARAQGLDVLQLHQELQQA